MLFLGIVKEMNNVKEKNAFFDILTKKLLRKTVINSQTSESVEKRKLKFFERERLRGGG